MVKITKRYSTTNTTEAKNRKIEWLVIHYTAGTSSKAGNALNTADWFGSPEAKASADFICDDATIIQTNPDIKNRYCWAVGGSKYTSMTTSQGGKYYGKCTNRNSISIEMCSNKKDKSTLNATDKDWFLTAETVSNALELARYLMDLYSIDINHVIMHHHVTGKICPQPWTLEESYLSGWDNFIKQLKDNAPQKADTAFKVKVKAKSLNVRNGAGTKYKVNEAITDKGVYTIVATKKVKKSTWGKLKSGAGWINLKYTKRL